MATRYAVATGNWSNTATWDGGTLPTSADDVFADGKTVTINQNVTVLSLRTTQRAGGTAGGGFTTSGAYTIDCSGGIGIVPGSSNCLTVTTGTGVTTTLLSKFDYSNTSNSTSIYACDFSGNGTLNVTGSIGWSSGGVYHYVFRIAGTGSQFNFTGNVSVGAVNTVLGAFAPIAASTATINVTGNCQTQETNVANVAGILVLNGSQTATITGAVTGSPNTKQGIYITGANSVLNLNGTLTAGSGEALRMDNGVATVTGPFISSATGVMPFATRSPSRILLSPISNNEFRFKTASGTSSLFSSDVTSGAPTANNVRLGTVYGGGALTGTLAVPSPSYVLLGIATDNTTGTYDGANEFWKVQTSAITTAGSIGERLKNAATVDTTGAQIAAI